MALADGFRDTQGSPRRGGELIRVPAWSPDGKQIAFVTMIQRYKTSSFWVNQRHRTRFG